MAHKDSGWRPDVGLQTYGGHELWDHGIGPHEVNDGVVEEEVEFPDELKEGLGEVLDDE